MTELTKTIHEQDARREAPEHLATGGIAKIAAEAVARF